MRRRVDPFRIACKADKKLFSETDTRPIETAILVVGLVLLAFLVSVLVPFLQGGGLAIFTNHKPANFDPAVVDLQVKLLNVLTWAVGFAGTTLTLARSVRTRHEDDMWKAIDTMSLRYNDFCKDDSVNSVKRILESIEGEYSPVVYAGTRVTESSSAWIKLERHELRNGLTPDEKQEADGGFYVQNETGKWRKAASEHTEKENCVAYNIDGFCNHLVNFNRLLVRKPWLVDDFYVRLHYWIRLMCGLARFKSAERRARGAKVSNRTLEWWLTASVLELYSVPDTPSRGGPAWWREEARYREHLRVYALCMLYLADYYAEEGSDDIVGLLSRVVFSNEDLHNLDDPSGGTAGPVLAELFPDHSERVKTATAQLPDAMGRRVARLWPATVSTVAAGLPHDHSISNPGWRLRRPVMAAAIAQMCFVTHVASEVVHARRGCEGISAFKKVVMLALWRCCFELATVAKREWGLQVFDRRLADALAVLASDALGEEGRDPEFWHPVVEFCLEPAPAAPSPGEQEAIR